MLTQKALEEFERPLHRADHSDKKVAFAEETTLRVKGKLEAMKQSVGALCLILFDYNEKVIIRQAILLYTIELLDKPPSVKQTKELHQCRQITAALTDAPTPAL